MHAVGAAYSFSTVADTRGDLVVMDRMPQVLDLDAGRMSVTVNAAARYAVVAEYLHANGFGLHNLGSLPHISVAGACATGTHGSGDGNALLGAAVNALTLVNADGELMRLSRGDADFDGAVVALGALGVVTTMELDVEPSYEVAQRVYEELAWARLVEHLDDVTASGYSVSVFTRWDDHSQVWVKRRTSEDTVADLAGLGMRDAHGARHPVPGMPVSNCTQQLGVPGPWHTRLPHFRAEFMPSAGDELQSEYFVARSDARTALELLHGVRDQILPALMISEIRTVAADRYWLSPNFERDSVALHFTWHPRREQTAAAISAVEAALAPLRPRPHWGKLFHTGAAELADRYPRWADFASLWGRLDPGGKFGNDFADALFG